MLRLAIVFTIIFPVVASCQTKNNIPTDHVLLWQVVHFDGKHAEPTRTTVCLTGFHGANSTTTPVVEPQATWSLFGLLSKDKQDTPIETTMLQSSKIGIVGNFETQVENSRINAILLKNKLIGSCKIATRTKVALFVVKEFWEKPGVLIGFECLDSNGHPEGGAKSPTSGAIEKNALPLWRNITITPSICANTPIGNFEDVPIVNE